ncbi:hypothetical protein [Microbispora oryzae]|uniref:hypothetical protein n=1 Tax=Microbispora oryzae TaxID=2806554 RepID=UPI0035571FAD
MNPSQAAAVEPDEPDEDDVVVELVEVLGEDDELDAAAGSFFAESPDGLADDELVDDVDELEERLSVR